MGETMPTWRELFPLGRTLFYEGDDPTGFANEITAEFGFDPRECPGVYEQPGCEFGDYAALAAMPGIAKRSTWYDVNGWQFHCPPEHLDAIYGSGRWPLGS